MTEKEQRTKNQVEGIIFKKDSNENIIFLLMRRIPDRGGFWQPLTGGVRVGEELKDALLREIMEETGIKNVVRIINTDYTFNFGTPDKISTEYVFGVEVPEDTQITLSDEHDKYVWVSQNEALSLLKWPNNIEGLHRLSAILEVK